MKLMKVIHERVIVWPDEFVGPDPNSQIRARAGDVIDVDGPLEDRWLKGQMHKLAPAPEGAKANPITHPGAVRALAEHANPKAGKPQSAPHPAAVGGSLPGIDLPSKRSKD